MSQAHLPIAAFGLVFLLTPVAWAVSVNVPSDFSTIQQAIDAIEADSALADTIEIERGTYEETLTLTGAITLKGIETAAVFLQSTTTEAVLTLDTASNTVIQNLTFLGSSPGIELSDSTGVIIINNVFHLDNTEKAIISDTATDVLVINNTFYDNNVAIERGSESTQIQNNIFARNTLAISPDTVIGQITNNCFNDNTNDGPQGTDPITDDEPLFVSTSLGDYHLKQSSPCIDQGQGNDVIDDSTADMGAYGGDKADLFPFPVQNFVATDATEDIGSNSIKLSWSANQSHRIAGYNIYYDSDQSGTPYSNTIDVASATTHTLSDLALPQITPQTPEISQLSPSNQTIKVEWAAIANTSKYTLHYGIDNTNTEINVGNTTSYTLTGLENGVTYQFALSSIYQATYYLAVTTYDSSTNANESRLSAEVSIDLGEETESALSNIVSAIPEWVVPYPRLADEGCFIATAAYGFYDAPQVQSLRDFRDQYLLTNEGGKWLVNEYYTRSPAAAQYIEAHPEWKPLIRIVLLPAVASSWLLTKANWQAQAGVSIGAIAMFFLIYRRKRGLSNVKKCSRVTA